jgi:hypothetical protein
MKCDACKGTIPDDAQFCPACGTDIGAPRAVLSEPGRGEVSLAAANLLRLRRRFAEAESRCIEVLRADPNNVHGHSMLGDIYRDQGRHEDARQWYQLALDLDPKSRSDREKLARLRAAGSETGPRGDDRFAGLSSLTWVRFAGVALLVFVLAAAASLVVRRWRESPRAPEALSTVGIPTLELPPPARSVPDGGAGAAPRQQGPTIELTSPDATAADDGESVVEREDSLRTALGALDGLGPEIRVLEALIGGNGEQASVILRWRVDDVDQARASEDSVIVHALRAVHAVLQADPAIRGVEVAVHVDMPSVAAHTAFRAHADRDRAAADTGARTAERALRAFTWFRWDPAWRSAQPGAEAMPASP